MTKVAERPVHGIDIFVIRNVIPEIGLWRRIARRNPNGIHPKTFQIVELGRNAFEVSNAVTVAVGEAARIDFVEHSVLPPLMAFRIRDRNLRMAEGKRQSDYAHQ